MPHLSHRREIYLLPLHKNAQYIVFDLHQGQNNWNFYTDNLQKAKTQLVDLLLSNNYKVIASAGNAYLLQKRQL